MSTERIRFCTWAIRRSNCPYVWAGKGKHLWTEAGLKLHPWNEEVFDCSGLVSSAFLYATGVDHRADWTASNIWEDMRPSEVPGMGTIACYGKRYASHVMIHLINGIVIGASGGDQNVKSPGDAYELQRKKNWPVCVYAFEGWKYRNDFLGWRELPFAKE